MASILVYAGVKGYKKYQLKRANSLAGDQTKSKKNRKSISSLIIPSIASAHIVPGGEEFTSDVRPPQYELYEEKASLESPNYTAPYSPDSLWPPTRSAPAAPVMLGLTLCESPSTPISELDGGSPIEFRSPSPSELQGDDPINHSRRVFELAADEQSSGAMSPAPLNVVKRASSPLPPLDDEPDMTYSSDDSEEGEDWHRNSNRAPYLEVPKSAEELLDFDPPPIPARSPARKLRAMQV